MIIFISQSAIAQQKGNIGFAAGGGLTYLSGDNDKYDQTLYRKAAYGGIFYDIYLEFQNTLEVGVFYSQQGGIKQKEFYGIGKKYSFSVNNEVDYVMFPLIWRQTWGELYTQIGMYGEVAINAQSVWKQETYYYDTLLTSTGLYRSFTHELRMYDVGALFGAGYQLPVTLKFDVFINFSYKFGFFPIQNKPESTAEIMRNRVFTLSTGIVLFNDDRHRQQVLRRKRR